MGAYAVDRLGELRQRALWQLQEVGVLMRAGHDDYGNGNGYHGRAYLNPHQLFLKSPTFEPGALGAVVVVPDGLGVGS